MPTHITEWLGNAYLDYNAITLGLDALAERVRSENFNAIVIVLRGGTFAGMHMSFLTGLPVYFIAYHRADSSVEWIGSAPNAQAKVLLCEDSAGKGTTLLNCRNFLRNAGYAVSTLVVCKVPGALVNPEYICIDWKNDDLQVLFPWNRYRINGESRTDDLPDHEYEHTAWDLDGVFLDDLKHDERDNDDLAGMLARRDEMPLGSYAPMVSPGDVIITSRPEIDRERTEKWLRKFCIDIPVVLREEGDVAENPEFRANWKGKKALELGYTHFVESSSEQALYLAARYPELRVTWYNQGNRILVNASKINKLG